MSGFFPAYWLPILHAAAGAIIGFTIMGMVGFGIYQWWNGVDDADRRFGFWMALIALAVAVAIVWMALAYKP